MIQVLKRPCNTLVAILITVLITSGCHQKAPKQLEIRSTSVEAPSDIPSSFAGYAGQLVYSSDGDLYAMHSQGHAVQNLTNSPHFEGMPTWSPDGRWLAFSNNRVGDAEITVAPASIPGETNRQVNISQDLGADFAPAWSPDGRSLAFVSRRNRSWGIFVVDLLESSPIHITIDRGPTRLTSSNFFNGHPSWSPDGERIAYTADSGFQWTIYVMARNGANKQPFPGLQSFHNSAYPAWSPDGTRLAFASNSEGNWEIYIQTLTDNTITRLTHNQVPDWQPVWSPDSEWMLFTSMRNNNVDLYVVKADGSSEGRLTNSPKADAFPAWQPPHSE